MTDNSTMLLRRSTRSWGRKRLSQFLNVIQRMSKSERPGKTLLKPGRV